MRRSATLTDKPARVVLLVFHARTPAAAPVVRLSLSFFQLLAVSIGKADRHEADRLLQEYLTKTDDKVAEMRF
jgi:hypothetical protein